MKRGLTWIILFALGVAQAQTPAGPSPEMKKLEVQNGEWVGKAKNYMTPGEPPILTDVTLKIEFVMGGMYQRTQYFSEIPGAGKLEGVVMVGWDAAKGAYRSQNYNNFIPVPVEELSKWEGDAVVGKTAPLEAFGGMIQHTRMQLKGKDELLYKIEAEMGGQRTPMMEMELKRKK